MQRLAIISTHPIQYYAPIFQLLSQRGKINIKVFYTWSQSKEYIFDHSFRKEIKWDIPLLEGYEYTFVNNISKNPGTHHRNGIICPTLIQEIEEWDPDVILVFGWFWKALHKVLKYFKNKKPLIFRGDSNLLNEKPGLRKITRRLYLWMVYRNIDKALYVGKNNKDYYLAHGIKENQLFNAPHAVDNKRFTNPNKEYNQKARQWRKELGLKDSDFTIVFAGKFETVKNPLLLINALQNINKEKDIKAHLILVGNGDLESKLKEKALNDRYIHFLPFQNQTKMPVMYRLGHFYCLPSLSETWGLSVNEAMASGRPAIVSNKVGCAADVIQENINGYTFLSNNIDDLKAKILLAQKSDWQEMGKQAQSFIQDFSFEKICEALEEVVLSYD